MCRLREALYVRAHRCQSQRRDGPAIIVRWLNQICSFDHSRAGSFPARGVLIDYLQTRKLL
eukprot:6203243-Pleurochrysis_carterae.AAC.1